ncbi:MAG: O-antigen ligase family protein [Hyphomicrobiaceae bacterium]
MHNDTPLNPARWSKLASCAPGAALLAIVVVGVAPRTAPFMLLLLGTVTIGSALTVARPLSWRPIPDLVVVLAVFGAYIALNALWSVAPMTGLGRALIFALVVGMGLAVARALPMLTDEDAARLQWAVFCGIAVMALFLAFEVYCGQPVRRWVVSFIPPLRPSPKHMAVADGWVTRINLYTLNRNIAVLNLMLWPALLLLRAYLPKTKALLVGCALLALTAVASFASEHETSMIALVVSCLVLAGMVIAASVTRVLVIAAWVAATLLVVPAANIAHDAGLHRAGWLPQSARNRVILWNVTADRMQQSPILGIGIESTKPLDQESAAEAPREPGDGYSQRTGRHAHNIFMQTWYELGAVGALLLLIAGFATLRAMSRLPLADQPYAFASFASTIVLASFTWGMWQPWFMCAFGLWGVLLLTGLDAARRFPAR